MDSTNASIVFQQQENADRINPWFWMSLYDPVSGQEDPLQQNLYEPILMGTPQDNEENERDAQVIINALQPPGIPSPTPPDM